MTHAYHDALPSFHPSQILHDGCPECEKRGRDPLLALQHLDAESFRYAWRRAADLRASAPPSLEVNRNSFSDAEIPLLDLLWAVQLRFEPIWPLGTLPSGTR